MNESQIIELICEKVSELLEHMSISARTKAKIVDKGDQEVIWVNVETKENPRLLIGQKGTNLASLQHLVRLMVRRKIDQKVNFVIDVNRYKESRMAYLHKLALGTAENVIKKKEAIAMEAMSPYERRIVHMALADHEGVETESAGQEGERRVIVKPKG